MSLCNACTDSHRRRFAVAIIAWAVVFTGGGELRSEHGGDSQSETIRLADLPPPPQALAKLIEQAEIRFVSGPRDVFSSDVGSSSDWVAGETRFHFRYRYRSRIRWSIDRRSSRGGGQPLVDVRVEYPFLRLMTEHEIWIKQPPPADSFWQSSIVRHEFDHVRISSHPAVKQLFREIVAEQSRFQVALADVRGNDGRPSEKRIRRLVDQRMNDVLDRTSGFVKVRYRELDRLTKHGVKPLPADHRLLNDLAAAAESAVEGNEENDAER
jgi:hypothetical protein